MQQKTPCEQMQDHIYKMLKSIKKNKTKKVYKWEGAKTKKKNDKVDRGI